MKSLPLYDEDLSNLEESDLREEIAELQILRSSPGWRYVQRLLVARFAAHREALVTSDPAYISEIASLQGKTVILRDMIDKSKNDDDVSGLLSQMIGARRERLNEITETQSERGAVGESDADRISEMMHSHPEMTYEDAMVAIYGDASGKGANQVSSSAIGNDSVPGSERGGRLEV